MARTGATGFALIGLQIAQMGVHVPDDYIANYLALNPRRAIGVASVDPTQPSVVNN
jgi:hypothetical protein